MAETQVAFSFEGDGVAEATPDSLKLLNKHLSEGIALKEAVDQMEEDLAAAKKQLNHMNTVTIPDLMAELQMDEVVQNKWKVKVGEFVSGSLPKDEFARRRAIRWLEDHGAGDLIKSNLSVAFSRSQHNEALDLAVRIENEGFAPVVESGVHPQTLAAFARERMKSGDQIDMDVLGLFTGKVAKYTKMKD